MFTILARLFIKDHRNYENPAVHRAYGFLCSCFAIFLNLLLVVSKMVVAHLSHANSIQADALNNLSDAGSSTLLLMAFYFAGMKPQPQRPFGHGRIEYVAGFFVAVIILVLGVELAKNSISDIIHPHELSFSWAVVGTLLASILVKCYMGVIMLSTGKKVHSSALHSTGIDSFSDTIATSAVVLGLLIYHFTPHHLNLDGWFGLFVSLLVIKAGYEAVKEPLLQLLGTTPDPEVIRNVERICRSYPEVVGIHDLVVHDYGPGRLHISVHCEVPGNQNIFKLHEAMDSAMAQMDRELGCISVIHMDPICVEDEHVKSMTRQVSDALACLGTGLHVHDFRVVEGPTHTNLIFDCLVPWDVEPDDETAQKKVKECVEKLFDNTTAIVHIDRPFA